MPFRFCIQNRTLKEGHDGVKNEPFAQPYSKTTSADSQSHLRSGEKVGVFLYIKDPEAKCMYKICRRKREGKGRKRGEKKCHRADSNPAPLDRKSKTQPLGHHVTAKCTSPLHFMHAARVALRQFSITPKIVGDSSLILTLLSRVYRSCSFFALFSSTKPLALHRSTSVPTDELILIHEPSTLPELLVCSRIHFVSVNVPLFIPSSFVVCAPWCLLLLL
jgi:hypothetical protein